MKKAVIFGVGNNYHINKKTLHELFDIVALIDNNSKLYTRGGIRPVDYIKDIDYDLVIITPTKYEDMYEQLLELGIKKDKISNLDNVISNLYNDVLKEYYNNENQHQIYVIGDSHVSFFSSVSLLQYIYKDEIGICKSQMKPFLTFHIGPALAYNLNKYGTTTKAREKIEYLLNSNLIPKGGTILCVFGEIDIRTHVFKQVAKRNIDYKQVVDEIVDEYILFLQRLSQEHKVLVWCPVASQRDDCFLDVNFPRIGTQIERNKATMYFEKKINEKCEKLKVAKCFSILSYLIDDEGKTKSEFYQDPVHLSPKGWIFAKDEFKKEGIICEEFFD